ncbi:hypothetical protein LXA43DRAFT_1065400 [Ganoderma leucocontextum]|nr:hypothetical protein LXA43DRAFT_1065400 [Ganoderma leucocontextum]
MSSGWSIEFSVSAISGHAWGMSIGEEFAAKEAHLCLLSHKTGSVYLTLVAQGSDEIFIADFGQYWQTSTYKRWGTSWITYRSGPTGIFLVFPDALGLQDYDDCCNRLLSQYCRGGPTPTLEVLQDIGVVPLPRLVGGFLARAPDYPRVAHSGDSASSSDEETDTGSSVYSADILEEEELKMLGEALHDLRMLA